MRKQFSRLEMDMADFIRRLIAKSEERLNDGFERSPETQAHYDEAKALMKSFDDAAKEIAGIKPEEQSLSEAIGLGIGGRGVAEY